VTTIQCDPVLIRGICKAVLEAKDSASDRLTDIQIHDIEWLQHLSEGLVADRKRFVSALALLRRLRDNPGIRAHWDSSAFTIEVFPTKTDQLFKEWVASCAQPETRILIKTDGTQRLPNP
jgi:hypothetical protein